MLGRATVTFPPLGAAPLLDCLALLGAFFADMEGEGDEDEAAAPFVCMPEGMGRLGFGYGGMTGGGIGVVVGAIATRQSTGRAVA